MTSIRTLRKRLNRMAYDELFDTLPDRLHAQVRERIVWAVIQLTTIDGAGALGTRGFLEDRARQLMIDSQIVGFSAASKRFRSAILRRIPAQITPPGRVTPDVAFSTEGTKKRSAFSVGYRGKKA